MFRVTPAAAWDSSSQISPLLKARRMILIAIGANLPGLHGEAADATCRLAAAAVAAIAGLRFHSLSKWYRTAPVPKSSQPDYCNGVIRMAGQIAPEALLRQLQEIETRFGRARGTPNAARTLDLDIIDLNALIRAVPDPVLPHPRAHLRAFVLRPILDVAPNWRHPALQSSLTSLLADLPPQEIEPWDSAAIRHPG
jgi:2-amino-4-hydroxy-6-hydroxymethyldihydropteridine diphosphokinase